MKRNILPTALVLVLLLGGGCRRRIAPVPPPPPAVNMIILLPKDDGSSSGTLVVSNAAGSQKLTEAYSAVKLSKADLPPGAPVPVEAGEVQRLFGDTLKLLPAPEARFTLYFETAGTVLTEQSRAELPKIIEAYQLRKSTDVTIIGHTDTVGDAQSNYQLGLERAEQISQDLEKAGVSKSSIFVESHGENDLLVPTPDNVEEPRNRRVEVIVR